MAVKLVSSTKIYLDARKLLDIILDIVPNFPRAYKFTIGAKLQEIGVNLMQEIAAAYINKDKAETVKHPLPYHPIGWIWTYLDCYLQGM